MMKFFVVLCCAFICSFSKLDAQGLPLLIPFNEGDKWGYADSSGNIIINAQWDHVNYFQNGKAIVVFHDQINNYSRHPQNRFALINTTGEYIIEPNIGWNGNLGGWSNIIGNVIDSSGKYGLIDDNGEFLIDCEWDLKSSLIGNDFKDSFKIVIKDNLMGLINSHGDLVVPCEWSSISSLTNNPYNELLVVQDPDNKKGLNSFGVIDVNNNVILEPRFYSIELMNSSIGKIFRVKMAANNQRPMQNTQISYSVSYLSYPYLTEVFPDDSFFDCLFQSVCAQSNQLKVEDSLGSLYVSAEKSGEVFIVDQGKWQALFDQFGKPLTNFNYKKIKRGLGQNFIALEENSTF